MKQYDLWSVPVWVKRNVLRGSRKPLLTAIFREMDASPGVLQSNAGGWQSKADLHVRHKAFRAFTGFAHDVVNEALANYGFGHRRPGISTVLTLCWASLNRYGSSNILHLHAGADITCVLFLQNPGESGELQLYNASPWYGNKELRLNSENIADLSKPTWTVPANSGDFVVFPATILHSVTPSKSVLPRITVSCDFLVIDNPE